MTTKKNDLILKESEQGFNLFLKFFPQLIVQKKYGLSVVLDSPFHHEKGTLNVYFNEERGKWFFYDRGKTIVYGDIFTFIARLHKLDYKRDFPKILSIAEMELSAFDATVLGVTEKINLPSKEIIELETVPESGDIHLPYFIKDADVKFQLRVVAAFKSKSRKQRIVSGSDIQYFSIEAIERQLYFLFDTKNFDCEILGKKPDSYFFGLEQAIKINFFINPPSKPNLLLCNRAGDVLIFSYLGIPAIYVGKQVNNNAYFQHIIAPTFPNLISVNEGWLPKDFVVKYSIKTFDLDDYIGVFDFRTYSQMESLADDFLEPLWDLFEHIDNDKLTD